MRFLVMLTAACCLGFAAPASAQDSNATGAKSPKEKKICRLDTATGSIVPKRVCHTRLEWNEIDKRNARDAEHYGEQRDSNSGYGASAHS